MGLIIAEEDIVKVGIWLRHEKYFKDKKGLQVLWMFYVGLTVSVQFYFLATIWVNFGILNASKATRDSEFDRLCLFEQYHLIGYYIVFVILQD